MSVARCPSPIRCCTLGHGCIPQVAEEMLGNIMPKIAMGEGDTSAKNERKEINKKVVNALTGSVKQEEGDSAHFPSL